MLVLGTHPIKIKKAYVLAYDIAFILSHIFTFDWNHNFHSHIPYFHSCNRTRDVSFKIFQFTNKQSKIIFYNQHKIYNLLLFFLIAAASVAVSSWTLVAISCERYYAICHPLRSRTWQTINHAYKIIGCIWIGSILCMAPIAIFSQLIPTSRQGKSNATI